MHNIEIGSGHFLSIEDVDLISRRQASLSLSKDKSFRGKIEKSAEVISDNLKEASGVGLLYGITTGFGDSCTTGIPLDLVHELPIHLTRFHGCGLGDPLTPSQTRAVLVVRLASLSTGYSGVTYELLDVFEKLLHHDILPVIPSEGSVGASGDLTPLSYVAALIIGEREALIDGKIVSSEEALRKFGLQKYTFRPKEALAVMNGTSVMTALAVEAYRRAEYVLHLATRLTSLTSLALLGNETHFHKALFEAKPHPGQMSVAAHIRSDLAHYSPKNKKARLQDRYSTRCAPHVIGVLADLLPTFKRMIETEINSSNDNPIVDVEKGMIIHGGNFYGGHIAFVMDSLKNLVANIADLLDRQFATLIDTKFNNGLPSNLSGATGNREVVNHGLKAVQIAASAWTAEALKGTMPASVFSRSTESHNQDKVSMGTIAARDALRVLELTEQVVAAQMIATLQAVRLRERKGQLSSKDYAPQLLEFIKEISEIIPFIDEDQRLDTLLKEIVLNIQNRKWSLYKGDKC